MNEVIAKLIQRLGLTEEFVVSTQLEAAHMVMLDNQRVIMEALLRLSRTIENF